ncbi:hypothetical protein AX14_012988 [Amanita brunnescens Koide BX004]|nr:hypothetical protein AX14_012988 [Amanita brunnescens Koide BX004]
MPELPHLDFEKLHDAFGASSHIGRTVSQMTVNPSPTIPSVPIDDLSMVSSNGTLNVKQSSHFLHALLNLHIIYSSQSETLDCVSRV